MPVERATDHPTFELAGNHVTSLAAPSRGSEEVALFRTELPRGVGSRRIATTTTTCSRSSTAA